MALTFVWYAGVKDFGLFDSLSLLGPLFFELILVASKFRQLFPLLLTLSLVDFVRPNVSCTLL